MTSLLRGPSDPGKTLLDVVGRELVDSGQPPPAARAEQPDRMGMNHFSMTNRKDRPAPKAAKQSRITDSAFDIWLNRGLHELFDDVAKEPIPEELLKLLKDSEKK